MGSRGAFVSTKLGNFIFREGNRIYKSVGTVSGINVLIQTKGSIKAPEFSHTPNRIYAILQDGAVKHIAYYDKNHHQSACIDFGHKHIGECPHKHLYLDHKSPGAPLNSKDRKNIAKIKRRFPLK
jgi:hypothetical protein